LENYIVFFISTTVDEEFVYSRRLEVARIQFSLFSKSPSTEHVNEMYEALTKVFDRGTLTFRAGDYNCVTIGREMSELVKEEDGYWHYIITYIAMVQPVTTTTAP
jgi:hypothetical protein